MPIIDLKGHTIEELASFANVSVDVIKMAIKMREQQMMTKKEETMKISTTISPKIGTITYRSNGNYETKNKINYNLINHKVIFFFG